MVTPDTPSNNTATAISDSMVANGIMVCNWPVAMAMNAMKHAVDTIRFFMALIF